MRVRRLAQQHPICRTSTAAPTSSTSWSRPEPESQWTDHTLSALTAAVRLCLRSMSVQRPAILSRSDEVSHRMEAESLSLRPGEKHSPGVGGRVAPLRTAPCRRHRCLVRNGFPVNASYLSCSWTTVPPAIYRGTVPARSPASESEAVDVR